MKSRTQVAWPRIALMFGLLVLIRAPSLAVAAEPGSFFVTSVAEKKLNALPPGTLYWRVETFPELGQARAAAAVSAASLTATVLGKVWLFTLGPKGGATPGGTEVAEIGPVPSITAPEYLLRINHAGGPPGSKTPIHSHPGSETFYVLDGQVTQRTPDGSSHTEAGQSAVGHGAGMPMEVSSSGAADLNLLVMFVLDATKPFSTPAKIE